MNVTLTRIRVIWNFFENLFHHFIICCWYFFVQEEVFCVWLVGRSVRIGFNSISISAFELVCWLRYTFLFLFFYLYILYNEMVRRFGFCTVFLPQSIYEYILKTDLMISFQMALLCLMLTPFYSITHSLSISLEDDICLCVYAWFWTDSLRNY